ncbi:MAG: serine/threonine protein kinase [Myxococcales bacterium]|nr:serine/threonine protein kinase [Myxococcales bacterium]
MLLTCNSCHKQYVASHTMSDRNFVCSNCKVRQKNPQPTKFGIHPALEKKFGEQSQTKMYSSSTLGKSSHHGVFAGRNSIEKIKEMNSMPSIPGFDISYQVGRGAMGSVYRARQIKTGRLVAIKVLSYELSQRTDLIARFEREAYALKSLSNPNVVTVIDAGHIGDVHYFAMEFIDGITLRTRINRGPIPWREALLITGQILNGLIAAHKHGIIHRDLKPENVLLAYPDSDFSRLPSRVVLVDFGLVGIGGLAFDPHPNLTRSKVTMGTVNYMAPEQHVDAKRVDHRSDLYSCGVILFEMLTGDLPLGRYLMPSERGDDKGGPPKELDSLLGSALARNLNERFVDGKAFLSELNKIIVQEETSLTNDSEEKKNKKYFKFFNKKNSYAALVILASLFFAFGIKLSLNKTLPQKNEQAAAIND